MTAVERRLAAIWGEVLEVAPDSLDRNLSFFDLGGHSLLAVRLLAAIEEGFGCRPSLLGFLREPTIAALAQELDGQPGPFPEEAPERMPALLQARRGHGQTALPGAGPLFIATASYGNLPSLHHFGGLLDPERQLYTLQPPGRGGIPDAFETVAQLGELYATAILASQISGPYLLAGYSIGGLAAFEAAQRLMAAGCRVALLALVDTPFPLGTTQGAAFQRLLRKLPGALLPLCLRHWSRDAAVAAQLHAAEGYRPGIYHGRLALFSSSSLSLPAVVSATRWREVTDGGFENIRVPGRHDSMLRPPYVQYLAAALQTLLDSAQAGTPHST